jgi:tripartite-type tricarboxylate transporter receptor subunit TctC
MDSSKHAGAPRGRRPVLSRAIGIAVRAVAAVAAAAAAPHAAAQAQPYPSRPIQIVVGFNAGTTTDMVARLAAEHLRNKLGQPVVVINKPGANGAIGAQEVARANPDGHTFLITNTSSMVVNPHLFKKSGYQLSDFAPLAMVTSAPLIVTVNAQSDRTGSFRTIADLVAFARANPGDLNYAAAGPGNITGLSFRVLASAAGFKANEVLYKSAIDSQTAVMSKQVDLFVDTPGALPHIRSGRLTALAVTSPERWSELPQVPTMAEAGYPQIDVIFWAGMFAPAKTPPEILERIHAVLKTLPDDADLNRQLLAHGRLGVAMTPTQFAARVHKESEMWAQTIKRENIRLD